MKKVWAFIRDYVLKFAEGQILEEGGQALETSLEKMRVNHQEITDGGVVFLYMLVTTVGKDVVADTATEFDDHALQEVLGELIEYAERHNISLPEIDKP